MSNERRSSPRLQLLGQLHGQLVALDVPITVTEISLGGLRMETGIEFPVGATHEFALTLGDESVVRVRGRVMHSGRVASGPDHAPRFIIGVQFVDDDDASDPGTVGAIIKRLS